MSINEIIAVYLTAKAQEAAANKAAREAKARAEAAAADIMRHAADRAGFETESYTVGITRTTSIILDTEKLYHDFPGIKALDQYGKESPRVKINAIPRQTADTVSA